MCICDRFLNSELPHVAGPQGSGSWPLTLKAKGFVLHFGRTGKMGTLLHASGLFSHLSLFSLIPSSRNMVTAVSIQGPGERTPRPTPDPIYLCHCYGDLRQQVQIGSFGMHLRVTGTWGASDSTWS